MATPSRRTGPDGVRLLRERLAGVPGQVWDGSGENPYFAYLAVADALIVTADSVSMVSEAAATGKPVHIVDLPGGDAKFARFHAAMRQAGITRPFAGEIEHWSYRPPDDTARAGAALRDLVARARLAAGTFRMKPAGASSPGPGCCSASCSCLFPAIDLAATGLFYVPGEGFPLAHWAPLVAVEDAVPWITQHHRLIVAVGARLAGADRPPAVAPRPQGAGVPRRRHRARSRADRQHGPEGQLGPGAAPPDRFVRRHAPVHPGAAAGGAMRAQLRFCLGPCRARLFRSSALPSCSRPAGAGGSRSAPRSGSACWSGSARIAAGAHFLSDVGYAGLIVVATSWLLYEAIVARDLLASRAALRVYRSAATGAGAARRVVAELYSSPAGARGGVGRRGDACRDVGDLVDRPPARPVPAPHAEWKPPAEAIQRLGFGTPYLVAFGIAFVALRWGGLLPRLRPWADGMREAALVPAFLLVSIAASGLAVDLLKVVFGRDPPEAAVRRRHL